MLAAHRYLNIINAYIHTWYYLLGMDHDSREQLFEMTVANVPREGVVICHSEPGKHPTHPQTPYHTLYYAILWYYDL
jgi:hypothetical protein